MISLFYTESHITSEYTAATAVQSDCSVADCRIASADPSYLLEIIYSGSNDEDKKINFFDDSGLLTSTLKL